MRNPLTFRVESWIGALLLLGVAGFFIALMFSAQSSFSSDLNVDISMSTQTQRRHKTTEAIAQTDRALIDAWIAEGDIVVPPDVDVYKFVLKNYPDKPWRK